jgi:predicted O-methyltransferase YrrM
MNSDGEAYMDREFRVDWCKKHYKTWNDALKDWASRRDKVRYLEIGVFEGRSACYMLDNILSETSPVTLIDDWKHYRQSGSSSWQKFLDNNDPESIKARAARNLSSYADRVRWLDGNSTEMLKKLLGESAEFDLIYVDGGHTTKQCWEDSSLSWHLLAAKGLMMIDDIQFESVRRVFRGLRYAVGREARVFWRTENQACFRKVRK